MWKSYTGSWLAVSIFSHVKYRKYRILFTPFITWNSRYIYNKLVFGMCSFEISSWTLKDKFHISAHPCIILYSTVWWSLSAWNSSNCLAISIFKSLYYPILGIWRYHIILIGSRCGLMYGFHSEVFNMHELPLKIRKINNTVSLALLINYYVVVPTAFS